MSISRHQAVGAYRRWEPDSFDEADDAQPRPQAPSVIPPPEASLAPAPAAPEPEAAAVESHEHDDDLPADFKLPTAEEIERMQEDIRTAAMEEGRREGHAEAYAIGLDEGYSAGKARAEEEAARLAALADTLDQSLSNLDHEVADELMALAIELARQMVRQTLVQHPDSIVETVRSALQQLPQGHAHIHLHPADLALAREHLGEQLSHAGHRLQEDPALARGDCRIDAAGAQVDATLETRWRRVLESLGHEHARFAVADEPDAPHAPDAAPVARASARQTPASAEETTAAGTDDSIEPQAEAGGDRIEAAPGENPG